MLYNASKNYNHFIKLENSIPNAKNKNIMTNEVYFIENINVYFKLN